MLRRFYIGRTLFPWRSGWVKDNKYTRRGFELSISLYPSPPSTHFNVSNYEASHRHDASRIQEQFLKLKSRANNKRLTTGNKTAVTLHFKYTI